MARGRQGEVEVKAEVEQRGYGRCGRVGVRRKAKGDVENVKDKGMRFIASELGLNLSLNLPLGLNLILPLKLRLKGV
jgi:hypothetical protein